MTTLCLKTKQSIFRLLLYFTRPANHSKCYVPCQECPCYSLERIRNTRREGQAFIQINKAEGWCPAACSGLSVPVLVHSLHCMWGQGGKMFHTGDGSDVKYSEGSMQTSLYYPGWGLTGGPASPTYYKRQAAWGKTEAGNFGMAHLVRTLLIQYLPIPTNEKLVNTMKFILWTTNLPISDIMSGQNSHTGEGELM